MEITFDKNGYLTPYDIVSSDLETLEEYFVKAFPGSETREPLFQNYVQYVNDLKNHITPQFTQWIDGSFITRKLNPKDIDLVTFIDARVFQEKEQLLEDYWSFSLEDKGLDAYLLAHYEGDATANRTITEIYQEEWRKRFILDRFGNAKGFLELQF